MRKLIIDIETDGLDDATKIHCCVCRDVETEEYKVCYNAQEFRNAIVDYDQFIGHGIINFDWYQLRKIWGITLPAERVRDTLILSQLLHQGIEDGHSLEAWGERLGVFKRGVEISDFSVLTEQLLDRCISDTETNCALYHFLNKKLDRDEFKEAIDVEHRMAFICLGMHLDGFKYDKPAADILAKELDQQLNELDTKISSAFKPKAIPLRVINPRRTKHGTWNRNDFRWYKDNDLSIFNGGSFTLFEYKTFNPNSNKDLRELLDTAGWQPVNKTKSGKGYKIDEQNLATLPENAPESARLLVKRLLLVARQRTLATWAAAYSKTDSRIHGRFHTLGTYTHRMSHTKPNMGNVSAEKSIKYKSPELKTLATELGGKMRKFWIADDDAWLVGTDMAGAHLRILGHLMDDQEYIKSLLEGKKEDGTDIHSRNRRALGDVCSDRDLAKTFIFTFLNGGGVGKVCEIFGCERGDGARALNQFIDAYPGLRRLREVLFPQWAKRKFFQGPDGRLVFCDSEHHMMATVLQNYEAVLMKHANVLWRKELHDRGIKFKQVNFVHDEFQTEVYDSRSVAEDVGRIQSDCIRRVGERFGIRCPLDGEYSVGRNWLETH